MQVTLQYKLLLIITNNHETVIHQHKSHVYIQTTVLSSYMLTLSRNQVHGNLTNKDWRKASNIINPLCTNKGYNNSRPRSNRQTVQSW